MHRCGEFGFLFSHFLKSCVPRLSVTVSRSLCPMPQQAIPHLLHAEKLENNLKRELPDARVLGVANAAEAARAPCCGVVNRGVVASEIHAIEDVKELGAELNPPAFSNGNVLEEAHVTIERAGPAQTSLADTAERAQRGVVGKRAFVEEIRAAIL